MQWGNGRDANGQRGYPQGTFPHDAPTPAYPSGGQGATPPYQPKAGAGQKNTQTPAQRLADARRTARTPRQAANPDGTSAPLPGSLGGGSRTGSGGRGRVVQRFSGSGLAPKAKVQRQERRAKRATLALAAIAVVLIAASAFMLFAPSLELPSFGFALNQRIRTQNSDVPLYIDGTQPPTGTPSAGPSSATPTPPGSNGGGSPTATPKPTVTPTPRPTFTPTPIPTVIPGGATVTFTIPPAQTLTSNGAMTACGSSSCTFKTRSGSGQTIGSYFKQYVSGYKATHWVGHIHIKLNSARQCFVQPYYCNSNQSSWAGGATVDFYDSSTGSDCKVYLRYMSVGQTADVGGGSCSFNYTYYSCCTLPYGSVSGSATGVVGHDPDSEGFFSFWNAPASPTNGFYHPTNNDCAYAINNAYPAANNNVGPAAANWANSNGFRNQVVTGQSNAGGSCNPCPGCAGGSVTGYAHVNYSVIAWSPADAQSAAVQ